MCPLECFHAGDVCGPGWVTKTLGTDCNSEYGCQHICFPHTVFNTDLMAPHMICQNGNWVRESEYNSLKGSDKVNYYSYNSGLGWKGKRDEFKCKIPEI